MFVPIDLLKPILSDSRAGGAGAGAPGTDEVRGHLFVSRVSPGGPPSARARGGGRSDTLPEFYSRIWSRGAAGVDVSLRVLRGAQVRSVTVRSVDRAQYFKGSTAY